MSIKKLFRDAKHTLLDEVKNMKHDTRRTKANAATFFAIFCVAIVLVGNVVLLIAINFWLSIMPVDALLHNSSQIAVQVISLLFILALFTSFVVAFIVKYGAYPLWDVLVSTQRMGNPFYRMFLLFGSGATNGISTVLSTYALTYTPQYLQAVLLCAIPFSAQAWTVIFIPVERKRRHLSLFFIFSFLFFIGGAFLASTSSFTDPDSHASVPWTLIYLASAVVFGLWCVVQRLYLDAIVHQPVEAPPSEHVIAGSRNSEGCSPLTPGGSGSPVEVHISAEPAEQHVEEEQEEDEDSIPSCDNPHNNQRQWAKQNVDDTAAKLVLLYVGVAFQILVTFVCFPVDAIPWFGTSKTVGDAWNAFDDSVDFIFDSWINVRYGLLYSLGFAMSFIGCTYLNEHSPTLASVVLQLAGPVTSLMLVIVPKWNVYDEPNHIGEKIGGICFLFISAILYHFWFQHTSRLLAERLRREEEEQNRGSGNSMKQISHGVVDLEKPEIREQDIQNLNAEVLLEQER